MRAALLALVLAACQGAPAELVADAAPDAAPLACDETIPLALAPHGTLGAGGAPDMWHQGSGAWVLQRMGTGAPRPLLYVEAYRDRFVGDEVVIDEFGDWESTCVACVFVGVACHDGLTLVGDHAHGPLRCDHLYLLERGVVGFARLEPDPYEGAIEGTVTPLAGDDVVRLAEVAESWERYGDRLGTTCATVPALAFAGSWSL